MNVILDIDGTLVDHDEDGPIARPHLTEFLSYVFEHFERVSIWTAASTDWFQKVYDNALAPAMPVGKVFDFIWTQQDCELERYTVGPNSEFSVVRTIKPLEKVWRTFFEHYNKTNTYIIDDTPETYAHSIENAIPISEFVWSTCKSQECSLSDDDSHDTEAVDSELLRIIEHFRCHLLSPYTETTPPGK